MKFEFENCEHFELTAESHAYEPHCEYYASKKSNMTDVNRLLRKAQDNLHPGRRQIFSMTREVSVIKAKYSDTDAKLQHINEALNDKMLLAGLKRHVHISVVKMYSLHATVRKGGVDVPTLSRNLGISLEMAK
jgi:chromosome segregation ATPase